MQIRADKRKGMSLFAWNSSYALGIPQIDAEHQRLFALAEQLHGAMLKGAAKSVERELLASLVSYTRSHFAHEEQLMLRSKYPDYLQHKADHEALATKVVHLQNDLDSGRVSLSVEILKFLKDWLSHHICGADHRIAEHLRSAPAVTP